VPIAFAARAAGSAVDVQGNVSRHAGTPRSPPSRRWGPGGAVTTGLGATGVEAGAVGEVTIVVSSAPAFRLDQNSSQKVDGRGEVAVRCESVVGPAVELVRFTVKWGT
jgi:hypothetical protein